MSDFDPNRVNDLRDRDFRYGSEAGSSWAWIVGAIAVVVVVLVALGLGRNDTQTASTPTLPPAASTSAPPSTTGMGTRPTPAQPATPAVPATPPAATPAPSTNQ